MKEYVSLARVSRETEKDTFSVITPMVPKKRNASILNVNDTYSQWKIELTPSALVEKIYRNIKNIQFEWMT